MRVPTQRGVIITGSRSTSARIISNEVLPEPITIPARSSTVGTPDAARARPTSWRLARCGGQARPLAEAAEVDDAAHAGVPRRGPEGLGAAAVGLAGSRRRPAIECTR